MTDLDSFFAKKKDKKKSKTIQMDALNSTMDRKVKKQEELERAEQEEQNNANEFGFQEDGEWIDYDNMIGNRGVEGLAINTMNIDDTEEEGQETSEEQEAAEPKEQAKTWATIEQKAPEPELIPSKQDLHATQQPNKYVPPAQRQNAWGVVNHSGTSNKIDINNQEMFPTFAAAEQIEKHKKEDLKNAWTTAGAKEAAPAKPQVYQPPRGDAWTRPSSGRDRDEAMAAARAMGATATAPPLNLPKPPALPDVPELKKSANAYVPPHLRNK